MKDKNYLPRFFLGANSPGGFFSKFDNLYKPDQDWFCYIIKGGPGTGKSTLMKKLMNTAINKNIKVELIYCSSDSNSLDAVIFPELKTCVVDGTSPHTLDPSYPGVSDIIINMSDFWNNDILNQSKDKIINLTKLNSSLHIKAKRYLSACGYIDNDISKIISEVLIKDKISKFTSKIIKKSFKSKPGKHGNEAIKFISGISPDGFIFFDDTISNFYTSITIIEDTYGIVGSLILSNIRTGLLANGYDIITCPSPMSPKNRIECLLIPETNTAFAISDYRHPLDFKDFDKKIHAKRFVDIDKFSKFKHRMSFNRKISTELLNQAIHSLSEAKKVHDKLEELYIKAMDFEKVNLFSDELSKTILG